MLTHDQLKAIDKLEALVNAKIAEIKKTTPEWNSFHNKDLQMLLNCDSHIQNVRKHHTNKYAESSINGSLEYLRAVARHFKFNLKD